MRKIPTRLRGTNSCTSLARFTPSFVSQPNGPKCTQIVQNAAKCQFRSNGVDRVRSLRKIPTRLCGSNICTSSAHFPTRFVRQPNGPECTQIVRNTPKRSLGCNGLDQVHSLQKIPTRLRGTNFCTSSARVALCFVRQPNGSECTQIVRNAPKHQFSVQ